MIKYNQIEKIGDNNIIVQDANGANITLNIQQILEMPKKQIEQIQLLLDNEKEENAIEFRVKLEKQLMLMNQTIYDKEVEEIRRITVTQLSNTTQPLANKTIKDLDKAALRKLFSNEDALKQFHAHFTPSKASIEKKLRDLALMSNGKVIKGTFMCLCHVSNMRGVAPNAGECMLGVFESTDKTMPKKSEPIFGNLITQYEKLIDLLKIELGGKEVIDILKQEWDYEIPERVFRELIANAFIHSDYNDQKLQTRITVELYSDKILIRNPGAFPMGINPNEISAAPKSIIRNPEIAQIFRLHNYIEKLGSGLSNVRNVLLQRGMEIAEYLQDGSEVIVVVKKKKKKQQQIEKDYLNIMNEYNMLSYTYKDLGNYEQAVNYALKAVEIQAKILSSEHIDLAVSYRHLSTLYTLLQNWELAVLYAQKELLIWLKTLPFGHLHIKKAVDNMKNILAQAINAEGQEKYKEVQDSFKEAAKAYL